MPTSEEATITLSAAQSLEWRVLDAQFKTVASDVGNLTVTVKPGIYKIQCRGGAVQKEELVDLKGGQTCEKSWRLAFPTPVPLEGTSTSRESYQMAVQHLVGLVADSGGLLIFIRNMERGPAVSITRDLVKGWTLLDAKMSPILSLEREAEVNESEQWIGLSVPLTPGGYLFHVDSGSRDSFVQPIWVSQGWLTGLFIPNVATRPAPEGLGETGTASASSRVLPELASVQIRRPDKGWVAFNQDSADTGQAVELALARLREGRGTLPSRDLDFLLNGKFKDPMLGLIGAHALLTDKETSTSDRFEIVIGNLNRLVPGHPDLLALTHMGFQAGRLSANTAGGLTWPPMLLASYRGLLACDAHSPGAIAEGSPAEEMAEHLIWQGSWTAFRSRAVAERRSGMRVMSSQTYGKQDLDAPGERDLDAPGELTERRFQTTILSFIIVCSIIITLLTTSHLLLPHTSKLPQPWAILLAGLIAIVYVERWLERWLKRRRKNARERLESLRPSVDRLASIHPKNPVDYKVLRYLRELAAYGESDDLLSFLNSADIFEISRQISLPVATVRRSMAGIMSQVRLLTSSTRGASA